GGRGGGGAAGVEVVLPTIERTTGASGAVLRAEAEQVHRRTLAGRQDALGIDTRVLLALGRMVHASHYLAAQRLRAVLYGETRAAFAQLDLLALPTTPIAP